MCPELNGLLATLLAVSAEALLAAAAVPIQRRCVLPCVCTGSVETSVNLTNPLGYAEQVSLGVEYGTQATNVYTLALTKPKPLGRSLLADVRLHQQVHSCQTWSSYVELVRGGAVTLSR